MGRPERELGLLGDVRGIDVLELGCGTAYWSAWLQRRGARPIGLDLTSAQLATARRMQEAHGQRFPLLEADGEAVPLRDGCVDLVFSEEVCWPGSAADLLAVLMISVSVPAQTSTVIGDKEDVAGGG